MFRNLGIGSWIARRARMTPHRLALIAGDRRWTYAELDERITCLARALLALGIGDGDRVGFLGGNHPAALETLFACGLLGAIAVPLHPGLDDASLRQVGVAAELRALIVTPAHAAAARRSGATAAVAWTISTGAIVEPGTLRYEEVIAAASAEPLDRPVALSATCLLAFSSGTTGPTKGVVLSHENLLFNVVNLLSCVDYVRDDVILASAPLHRMGGLGFTLPVLFKGGTAVLADAASPALVEQHGATILFDSPEALAALARDPAFARADLSSLRVVATGGSTVPRALVETYLRRGLRLRQGYGLTEASPVALLLDPDDVEDHVGAAGRPPLYATTRVVTPALDDAAPGELGELLVHGPNVMQGYWRQPAATARAIVDGGWLRTGDAAVVDAGGMVSIAGRAADVLVCAGRRVDPGPLEDALRRHTGGECAVVQACPGAALVAFVVTCTGVAPAEVAAICRDHLPAGWAPEVRPVAALPRNANGKLLRRELRARVRAR